MVVTVSFEGRPLENCRSLSASLRSGVPQYISKAPLLSPEPGADKRAARELRAGGPSTSSVESTGVESSPTTVGISPGVSSKKSSSSLGAAASAAESARFGPLEWEATSWDMMELLELELLLLLLLRPVRLLKVGG